MGPDSVGSQHTRYFNSIGRDVNPVDTFWIDISRLVHKSTDARESVVILADWNNDVMGGDSEVHGRTRYEGSAH
jgi:hypothetical protein